ncbi:amino acid ABC transporter permease [Pelomonas sp. KK5]|uniref:amino acid ABC transporter permease n=1 Tax=Pelomonas sp. KK5 TaxID=1855730 RepID=UPI00097C169C|nr:amino acid ABC transporter permease [Pelomonas sp. KK5]
MLGLKTAEFMFLLGGLKWTLLLSLVGLGLGAVAGLLIALARSGATVWLRRLTAAYIGVFQGTPLLMQLFVTYYGLALFGFHLEAWESVAVGFTLNASAFLGEIWRGAIQAVPRGQTEAAQALGVGYIDRMRFIVLPQALKISLPATIGYLVQLIKGTSLAAIVGFTELSRAGNIVSNQTFKPLLVYGIVGALYFALCWPLSLWGSRLERRLATAAR